MNLYDALRAAKANNLADELYGATQESPMVVGVLSKPAILVDSNNEYLLYIICIYVAERWRGDQTGLSIKADRESIQSTIGRFWRCWNPKIDQYQHHYQWQPMTLDMLVAYNRQQHARPRSEKCVKDSWGSFWGSGLALGG